MARSHPSSRKRPHARRGPVPRGRPTPRDSGDTVLHGINAVECALKAGRRTLHSLHLRAGADSEKLEALEALAGERGIVAYRVSPAELEGLCHTSHHQGAVLRCGALPLLDERSALALGTWQASAAGNRAPPLLVALDQVEDPRNLGAVVRSAQAFGAAGLVLPRDHSAPLSAVASTASAGALETFPVHAVANLARFLESAKQHGFWTAGAVAEGGEPLVSYTHDRPLVLVLGNEGRGLRPLVARACDQHLSIPMPGNLPGREAGGGSLNVSAAAAVLLYHLMTYR